MQNQAKKKQKKLRQLYFILVFAVVGVVSVLSLRANAGQEVADNFERQNLGANWSIQLGNVAIVNQSDLGFSSQSPVGIVTWSGSALVSDQYSEAVISSDRVTNMLNQVFVRRRSSDAARYGFHYDNDPNDGITDAWQIKYDGVPTAQTRILASSTVAGPVPGDTLRLEVRGSSPELKGYRNGVLILSATDLAASAITSGQPGMAFRLQVGTSTTYPSPVFESWGAGTLPASMPNSTPTSTPNSSLESTSSPTNQTKPQTSISTPDSSNSGTTTKPVSVGNQEANVKATESAQTSNEQKTLSNEGSFGSSSSIKRRNLTKAGLIAGIFLVVVTSAIFLRKRFYTNHS